MASTSARVDCDNEYRLPILDALLCKEGKKIQYGKQRIMSRTDRDYQTKNKRFIKISSKVGENTFEMISKKERARDRLRTKHVERYGSSRTTN